MEQPVAAAPGSRTRSTARLVSLSADGHRGVYDLVLQRVLAREGIDLVAGATDRGTDFFAMLDDDIAAFIRTALANVFLGRRTVGLFFRPGECFRTDKVKYAFKNALFRTLKHVPKTKLLTIMPFSVDPRFSRVANGWIYDPPLWDLDVLDDGTSPEREAVVRQVRDAAGGRRTIVAIGSQNRLKAFDFFCHVLRADARLTERYLFVAGGRVAGDCRAMAGAFADAGGLLIDRFISDQELLGLYDASDMVWSCYAPSYNQASGIFGRAFQLGKPTLLRRGSYMEALAVSLDHPHLAIDFNADRACAEALLAWEPQPADPAERARQVAAMREHAAQVLADALFDGKAAA